jgi:ubiquitin-small subunit ribosomal protein S27Ae
MGKEDGKGKKKHRNKPSSRKYALYKVEGDSLKREGKFCPRCGAGIFLSESKKDGRLYCGKCHYTEFVDKK